MEEVENSESIDLLKTKRNDISFGNFEEFVESPKFKKKEVKNELDELNPLDMTELHNSD